MPTEMELTLEQTQQGVSYEVSLVDIKKVAVRSSLRLLKSKCTVESRAKREHLSAIIHSEDGNPALDNIKQAHGRFDTSSGNPIKEILLKLNLPNHRMVNNQNAPEIPEFFKINEWQAKIDAKDDSIANLKKHIESLKGKNVIEKDATTNKAKVIAPGMFKLDLEPLSPKVLKNRDAHEVLVYVTATCPSLTKPSEKLVAIAPLNKNKKVRFAKHATSSSSTQKQVDSHKTQDSNKLVLPSTGMKSSTSASRSQPSDNTKNNRISRTTSSNQKTKVEDHPRSVKSSSNIKNQVIEPSYNVNVKHSMLNANSE
ncbi:hypothetical protein Tco_0680850 [Tanacetum coccineum]|uniref:Uncharacterized protein n=1 Tax=Tanacetum coccineum TaxID=301880 RepID=A0ABQ4XN41_9ASTR